MSENFTVYLPEDEYNNYVLWEKEETKRLEEDNARDQRIVDEHNNPDFDYDLLNPIVRPPNPYLNELLKSAFRKVPLLKQVGLTTFLKKSDSVIELNQTLYDHKNEIGGDIYG